MWYEELKKDLHEELEDVIKYTELAKHAEGYERQVLRDMAREEYTHAKHICEIMKAHNLDTQTNGLMERATSAVLHGV